MRKLIDEDEITIFVDVGGWWVLFLPPLIPKP